MQRRYLVGKGRILFCDDIQAWQFGPLVPEVYYQYCGFGSKAVRMNYAVRIEKEDEKEIDSIVTEKRCENPWELVEETHVDGKPGRKFFAMDWAIQSNIPYL